ASTATPAPVAPPPTTTRSHGSRRSAALRSMSARFINPGPPCGRGIVGRPPDSTLRPGRSRGTLPHSLPTASVLGTRHYEAIPQPTGVPPRHRRVPRAAAARRHAGPARPGGSPCFPPPLAEADGLHPDEHGHPAAALLPREGRHRLPD